MNGHRFRVLCPQSNETFVPATEQRISIYVAARRVLIRAPGLGLSFHKQLIFEPGSRSA